MSENTERRFKKLLKDQEMEKLDKPKAYYVVKYYEASLPEGHSVIYDKFRTKAERDRWYQENGREIVRIHGGFMEMPDEPMSEEEIKNQKNV